METRQRGQSCQRSAQCALGLACISGRCTSDLRSVAERSTVPNLTAGMGAGAGAAGSGEGAAGSGEAGAAP